MIISFGTPYDLILPNNLKTLASNVFVNKNISPFRVYKSVYGNYQIQQLERSEFWKMKNINICWGNINTDDKKYINVGTIKQSALDVKDQIFIWISVDNPQL